MGLKAAIFSSCDHPMPSLYVVLVSRVAPTFPGQLQKFQFPEFLVGGCGHLPGVLPRKMGIWTVRGGRCA